MVHLHHGLMNCASRCSPWRFLDESPETGTPRTTPSARPRGAARAMSCVSVVAQLPAQLPSLRASQQDGSDVPVHRPRARSNSEFGPSRTAGGRTTQMSASKRTEMQEHWKLEFEDGRVGSWLTPTSMSYQYAVLLICFARRSWKHQPLAALRGTEG